MTNDQIARRLREHASELSRTGGNLYRVRAYRQAAMAVMGLPGPVTGRDGLAAVPGIGASLADTIAEYAVRGVWTADTDPKRERASAKAANGPSLALRAGRMAAAG